MKKFILVVFAFVSICFSGCKEKNEPPKPVINETKEEVPVLTINEVENAIGALNDALVNPEKSSLEEMTSKALTYGHSSGNIQDRETFIDDLINGPFNFLSVDTSDESIDVSGDTAIARHVLSAKGTNKDEPVDVHIGIILIFQKQNGKLHLLARQAYKL